MIEPLTSSIRILTDVIDQLDARVSEQDAKILSLENQLELARKQPPLPSLYVPEPTNTVIGILNQCTSKIEAIKALRAFTNMGLKEAKDFVETHCTIVPF